TAPSGRGRWLCPVDEVRESLIERLADEGRTRAEDRRIALDQMVQFAESNRCRWETIYEHFASGDTSNDSCRCDYCESASLSAAGETPVGTFISHLLHAPRSSANACQLWPSHFRSIVARRSPP